MHLRHTTHCYYAALTAMTVMISITKTTSVTLLLLLLLLLLLYQCLLSQRCYCPCIRFNTVNHWCHATLTSTATTSTTITVTDFASCYYGYHYHSNRHCRYIATMQPLLYLHCLYCRCCFKPLLLWAEVACGTWTTAAQRHPAYAYQPAMIPNQPPCCCMLCIGPV